MPDLTLTALCVGYALYNAIRKTLPTALPLLMLDLGLSKSEVGQVASSFAVAYGCSKFGSSVISDYINCKKLFTLGLLCTSLASLLFPFVGSSVTILSVIWGINGLVQGVGWPSFSKIIYLTYSPEQRGTAWSAASTAGNVGLILGSLLFPFLLRFGWKAPFVTCGGLGVAVSLICLMTLPSDSDSDFTAENNSTSRTKTKKNKNKNMICEDVKEGEAWWSLQWLLSVPLCSLYLGSMCSFFLQKGLSDWAGLFFMEKYEWDASAANSLVFVNEVGGVLGSLAAGVVSDMSLVGHRKDVTCLLFSALLLSSLAFLSIILSDTHSPFTPSAPSMLLLTGCMLVAGVGANGPKTLLGLMVRNAVPVRRMGLAGGVLGFMGQIGGAVAGSGLGSLVESKGWGVFFPTLLGGACLCSGAIAVFMWYEKVKEKTGSSCSRQSNFKKIN